MKLLIVLSVIAYGYADKLDRAYLPPVNAATAGGSPGSLIAPGLSASGRPGSSSGLGGPGFEQELPSGRQPGSGQSRPTYGGVSGSSQNGPGFGTGISQGPGGFNQGTSGINQFQSGTDGNARQPGSGVSGNTQNEPGFNQGTSGFNQFQIGTGGKALAPGAYGKIPLLGANAPFGASQGTFGSTPVAGTYNVGTQQTYRPQSGGPSNQGFGKGTQGFNVPQDQAYRPERPQAASDRNADILKYINENNGESYLYSYETSNGISAEESGVATNGVTAQGGFSYTGDNGQAYSLTYTADENGFQPQGDHLPTPHPIPEEILKSIEENARAAAAGTQEGACRPEEYESEGPQQYNKGQTSFNRPQGQGQGFIQGSFSKGPATQAQSNQFSANQGGFGPSGQSGQAGQTSPGSNQFGFGPSGSQGQISQYQLTSGSNQGPVSQFGQSGQIGQVKPSQGFGQFSTGQAKPQGQSGQYQTSIGSSQSPSSQFGQSGQIGQLKPSQGPGQFVIGSQGQSGQYQTSIGSSQGPFRQSSGQGAIGQGLGQTSQGQGSNGYNYNQPENTFGSTTQFGSGGLSPNRPQANQGQNSIFGSQNGQGSLGLQSGKLPSSESPFGTSQFGQSQNLNRPGTQPTGPAGIFGQGQNQLNANKPFGSSQGSQVRPGSQGSSGPTGSGSSGYQYEPKASGPSFGNRPSGITSQLSKGSQYQPNANQPSGAYNGIKGSTQFGTGSTGSNGQIGQGPQNGNQPFGRITGTNQGSSPFGGSSGTQKPGTGSVFGQVKQPSFGSNVGPSQGSSQFGLRSQQSTSAQGPSGPKSSLPIQAPYQYDRPSQSFPAQQRPSSPGFPGVNGPSAGSQGINEQRPGVNGGLDGSSPGTQGVIGKSPGYTGSQGVNGRPDFTGTQGVSGQRPGGTAPGSQSVNGQRPSSPGLPGPSQGNQGGPEQFGGPRQPPSFSEQDGYKY